MNQIKKQIKDLIGEETSKIFSSTEGEIIEFDNEKMIATVKIINPKGPGSKKLDNVPVQLGSGGLSQSGPYLGDKVMISFKNGNINTPVIVSIIDVNHKNNFRDAREKHLRKGSMCSDNMCMREDWEFTDPLYEEILQDSKFLY